MESGYVKYDCRWIKTEACIFDEMALVNAWRDRLYSLGLIGVYKNGVGYGNISIRLNASNQFIITGTATGSLSVLNEQHYTKVVDFNLESNQLTCVGPIKASSESLTHGAVYQSDAKVNAVIHVHDPDLWGQLINKVPTTSPKAEYGTPEIAREVIRLFNDEQTADQRIIIMGGHDAGIITFGSSLTEAGTSILDRLQRRR